jgi:hypothetical protein
MADTNRPGWGPPPGRPPTSGPGTPPPPAPGPRRRPGAAGHRRSQASAGLRRGALLRAAGYGREHPIALAALERLLAAGEQLHRTTTLATTRGRSQAVYRPGPAPARLTGEQLRQRWLTAGLSQTELACHLGVSGSAVCMWEAAAAKPIPPGRAPGVVEVLAEHSMA